LEFLFAYHHSEKNRSLVPYGCWFNGNTETGICINLGSHILIEDRRRLITSDRTDMIPIFVVKSYNKAIHLL
jgi:hypothetical protein